MHNFFVIVGKFDKKHMLNLPSADQWDLSSFSPQEVAVARCGK